MFMFSSNPICITEAFSIFYASFSILWKSDSCVTICWLSSEMTSKISTKFVWCMKTNTISLHLFTHFPSPMHQIFMYWDSSPRGSEKINCYANFDQEVASSCHSYFQFGFRHFFLLAVIYADVFSISLTHKYRLRNLMPKINLMLSHTLRRRFVVNRCDIIAHPIDFESFNGFRSGNYGRWSLGLWDPIDEIRALW